MNPNADDGQNNIRPSSSAELFEVLSNSTRQKIIEILGENDSTFSELKRKIGIESSGHLQFHLSKLEPRLVNFAADGKSYGLTDEGKESLGLVGQVLISKSKLVIQSQTNNVRFGSLVDTTTMIWRAIALAMILLSLYMILGSLEYFETHNAFGGFFKGEIGFFSALLSPRVFAFFFEVAIIFLGMLLMISAHNETLKKIESLNHNNIAYPQMGLQPQEIRANKEAKLLNVTFSRN